MSDRIALPQDKGELVIARKINGMKNPSIEIRGKDIVPRANKSRDSSNGGTDSEYTLVARKSTRSGPPEMSSRAVSLKKCKGLSGCEFVGCVKEAFGKIPPNLRKACPTMNDSKILDNKLGSKLSI
jgi:hypothetical protein